MKLIDLLLIALVGLVCGTLAQLTSRYSQGGWIVHLGVGIFGALAGVMVARSFEVPIVYMVSLENTNFPIIWAIIGSVFFVAVLGFFVKPNRH